MVDFGTVNYVVLGIYLALMLGVGLFFSGRQKNAEQYFLAGRQMPWLVVGMSMFASLTSAITYMGVPGRAFEENIGIIFGVIVSPIVAPILIFTFYPYYRRLNVTTSYEFILARYGQGARFAVSALFILARLGWMGTVIYAPALALSVAAGVLIALAILLMGILATIYTTLGGLAAVLWTDVIQFVILLGGAVWVAVSLVNNVPGGLSQIFETAQQAGRLDVLHWRFDPYKMTAVSAALSWFLVFMQDYGTDQVTVQRLMAVRTSRGVAKAVIFNSISDVIITSLLLFIGLGLLAYYGGSAPLDTADKIFPYYIINVLPQGISGLLITAIFAAAMSSMDSGLNSLATVLVNDFVKPIRKSVISQKGQVLLARILTVLLGLLATMLAFYASGLEHIVKAWSTFMSLFSGPVLAIFLLGILSKRANFICWLIATVIAAAVTLYIQTMTELHWVYYFPVCFGISFTLGLILSVIFGKENTKRL